jgi:hypothetical protein
MFRLRKWVGQMIRYGMKWVGHGVEEVVRL